MIIRTTSSFPTLQGFAAYRTQVSPDQYQVPNAHSTNLQSQLPDPFSRRVPFRTTAFFESCQCLQSNHTLMTQMSCLRHGHSGWEQLSSQSHFSHTWAANTHLYTKGVWRKLRKPPPVKISFHKSSKFHMNIFFAFKIGILPIIFAKMYIKNKKIFKTLNLIGSSWGWYYIKSD